MLDVKQISDCLFSFNQLSFKDKNIVESLSNELVIKIPSVESTPVLRSILTSLGQIKYLNVPLVDAILNWYVVHVLNIFSILIKERVLKVVISHK